MNLPPGSSALVPKSRTGRRRLALPPPDYHVDVHGRCGIEDYLAAKEQYRKTATGFVPPPAPYEQSRGPIPVYGLISSQQVEIAAIIKRSGITVPDTSFERGAKYIWPIGRPHMVTEALIIKTTDTTGQDKSQKQNNSDNAKVPDRFTNSIQWPATCLEIHSHLQSSRPGVITSNFQVQIVNESLAYNDRSYPILNDAHIVAAIDSVRDDVEKAVESLLAESWSAVAWVLRGRPDNPERERRPTVLIYVKPGSSDLFARAEAELDTIISRKIGSALGVISIELVCGGVVL